MMTLAPTLTTKEPETARSANAMYDPFTGAITLDITTANGELLTFKVVEPQLLLETLSNALSEQAKDLGCIAEPL